MKAKSFVILAVLLVTLLLGQGVIAQSTQTPVSEPGGAATTTAPAQTAPAKDPYTVVVTDEMRSHQAWVDTLYFVGFFYGALLLIALLVLGISRRLRDLAYKVTPRPFLMAMIFFVLFTVVTTILSLPLDYVSDFFVPHKFALTDQTFGAWMWELTKSLILQVIIGAPLVAFALVGIRRIKRWWLALWLVSVPLVVFFVLIAPVVLAPMFNDFQPLKDEKLRTEILDIASKAGISGGRVFQVDKSKQTKTMNAYVNGLGPTKRIVLWDTIIAKMDHDELGFVMAHEMGHYVLNHIWKLLGMMVVILAVAFWVMQKVAEWAVGRWGPSWGFSTLDDPAALPLLMVVLSLFMFLASPVMGGISRHFERQCDTFAIELTHHNDAGARAFVKLAEDSKQLPDPNPFILFWRYSHPALNQRIAFCRSYKPWEKGEPNRLWQGQGKTGT